MTSLHPIPAARFSTRRKAFAAFAFLLIPAVALLTMLPEPYKRVLHTRGRFHSAGHFFIFALLAYAAGRSTRKISTRLLVLAAVLLFSFGTEIAEHFTFGGGVEWPDIAVDALGVLAGGLFATLLIRRRASGVATH